MYKYLLLIMMTFSSCGDRMPLMMYSAKDYDSITLEDIDDSFEECKIRYKNDLYEKGSLITINLDVVHIYNKGNIINNLINPEDNTQLSADIVGKLNHYFLKSKINFNLHTIRTEHSGENISKFNSHYDKYDTYGRITLLVYHTKKIRVNGIASGAPGTVAGVHASNAISPTVAHEIGHLFGLPHSFDSHKVCDIPENNLNIMAFDFENCAYDSEPYYSEEDLKVLIKNFMNYTGNCREEFTAIQNLISRFYISTFRDLEVTTVQYAS